MTIEDKIWCAGKYLMAVISSAIGGACILFGALGIIGTPRVGLHIN